MRPRDPRGADLLERFGLRRAPFGDDDGIIRTARACLDAPFAGSSSFSRGKHADDQAMLVCAEIVDPARATSRLLRDLQSMGFWEIFSFMRTAAPCAVSMPER